MDRRLYQLAWIGKWGEQMEPRTRKKKPGKTGSRGGFFLEKQKRFLMGRTSKVSLYRAFLFLGEGVDSGSLIFGRNAEPKKKKKDGGDK